jgi:hypothetical protein
MKALAIVLGLVGAALGPVGAGTAFFSVVGTYLSTCTGCTPSGDGTWLAWGMLVAAAGGLTTAIAVLATARRRTLLAGVELAGAVVLVVAMVLIALDSADLELYEDGVLAEVTAFEFLYAFWGAGAALLLAGALVALHSNEGYPEG